MNEPNRNRTSIQKRILELFERELPTGWSACAEEEDIRLTHDHAEKPFDQRLTMQKLYTQIAQAPEKRRELLYNYLGEVMSLVRSKSDSRDLTGQENAVYPVLRHASFLDKRQQGQSPLASRPHTAETMVLYALDREEGYILINEEMLSQAGWTTDKLHECAMSNLEQLPVTVKTDQVGANLFAFIAPEDAYAASRILLTDVLDEYERNKKGKSLGVAIPHQDVLVLADIHDEQGAQVLARLTYDFATRGNVPISPLPFIYTKGQLETYLVVKKKG